LGIGERCPIPNIAYELTRGNAAKKIYKEKIMTNKKFRLGMLVMVFGMTVVGCKLEWESEGWSKQYHATLVVKNTSSEKYSIRVGDTYISYTVPPESSRTYGLSWDKDKNEDSGCFTLYYNKNFIKIIL
jgi:hypothetical protein